MSAREYTRYAIQEIIEPFEFERLVPEILFNLDQDPAFPGRKYPDIRAIGGYKDRGHDAVSMWEVEEDEYSKTVFACSKRKDWRKKLEEDLNKRQGDEKTKRFVFITSEKAGISKLPGNINNIPIEIIDIEDIVMWLDNTAWGKSLKIKYKITGEEVSRRPELELRLLDDEGNAKEVIKAQPIIVKTKYVKTKSTSRVDLATLPHSTALFAALMKNAQPFDSIPSLYEPTESPKGRVPIGIEVTNRGEIPAEGIRIFLNFPDECDLVDEHDVIGGFRRLVSNNGGLFVDEDNKSVARAWIDILGNDLTLGRFERVYVRFPEKEQEYLIKARITQHGFPPSEYEFKIKVNPKIEEVVEYVDEEA